MRRFLALIDKTNTWIGKGISILPLYVAFAITYEILLRYVLAKPTIWAAESTVFACGIVYLLGGAWTFLEDKHVRIDLLYVHFSDRGRAVLNCCTFFFFALYVVVMLWATTRYAYESVQVLETTMSPWDPPIYPMKIAMALGLFLILLQGITGFIRNLHLAITGKPL